MRFLDCLTSITNEESLVKGLAHIREKWISEKK